MAAHRSVITDGVSVIISMAFDHRASPHDVTCFKAAVLRCPSVTCALDVTGTADFIVEATLRDMEAYSLQQSICGSAISGLLAHYDVNFVSKRHVTAPNERAMWVPLPDGMLRVECSKIDKVTAEGDYMRVHSGGRSWMVHSTMAALVNDCLDSGTFARLHRSILVRRDFIVQLVHERSHWFARLEDGTEERVAKANVTSLLDSVRRPARHASNAPATASAVSPKLPV